MSLLKKFERYPLTFGPTPIEHLPRLSEALGGKVQIYAKRDDCNSGLAMGGNKLRKLEYIVPDAIAAGADTLVSIGGVQSNHTRMVAATAAKIGMKCVVIQEKWVPHYDAVYDRVGNIMMTRLMGADSRLVEAGFDIGIRKSWEDAIQSVKDAGGKPYAIPAGASVHKFGALGYIGFAEEVAAQEKQLGFKFDYVIVCVVTGSTQAEPRRAGDRHRRVGDTRADAHAGTPDRRRHGKARRTRTRHSRGRDHHQPGLCLPRLRRAVGGNQRCDTALRPHRGDDHRPRLRRQIDAGHDRSHEKGLLPRGLEGAVRSSRRRAGAQRLQLLLQGRLSPAVGLREAHAAGIRSSGLNAK
jgi:1-aminocyclopropane-1-carboxylate deaminase